MNHGAHDPHGTRPGVPPRQDESLAYDARRLPERDEPRSEGPRQFGPFRLQRELGRGANGVVFLAQRPGDAAPLALKVLLDAEDDADSLARFELEAQVASKLWHPGIVPVLGSGRVGRYRYCALEYCAGPSLKQRLDAGPLSPREAVRIAAALARALDYAHAQGVLHRDVKPANVLLDPETGAPRLTDFGLAQDRSLRRSLTRTGDVLGTPAFMAPEQLLGERDVDRRVDVYSLGATLYQCLTGDVPYHGRTIPELAQAILRGGAAPPSERGADVPPELDRLCLRALAVQREDRVVSAGALAEALEAIEAQLTAPRGPARRRPARPAWVLGLAGAAVLGLGAVWLLREVQAPPADVEPPPADPQPDPVVAPRAPEGELRAIAELVIERYRLIPQPDSGQAAEAARRRIESLSVAYPADRRLELLKRYHRLFAGQSTALELYRGLRALDPELEPLPGPLRGVVGRVLAAAGFQRAGRDAVEAAEGPLHPWTGLSLMHLRALCDPPVGDVEAACAAAEETAALLAEAGRLQDPGENPPGFDVFLNLGVYRWHLGQESAAVAAIERGQALAPARWVPAGRQLLTGIRQGTLPRERALDRISGLFGIDRVGRVLQARNRVSRTEPAREAARVRAALVAFGGDAAEVALLELALGRALARAERPGGAERALGSALERARDAPEVRALVARALARLLLIQEPERALGLAREAALEPTVFPCEQADAWLLVARAELGRGRSAEARTALERAEALAPRDTRELEELRQQVE